MVNRLNEDMIVRLAARFETLPEMLRGATDQYVPADETPSFYKGYITGVLMITTLLSEEQAPINFEALIALASKAALLRQGLLAEEEDNYWLDQLNAWVTANYKIEAARTDCR